LGGIGLGYAGWAIGGALGDNVRATKTMLDAKKGEGVNDIMAAAWLRVGDDQSRKN